MKIKTCLYCAKPTRPGSREVFQSSGLASCNDQTLAGMAHLKCIEGAKVTVGGSGNYHARGRTRMLVLYDPPSPSSPAPLPGCRTLWSPNKERHKIMQEVIDLLQKACKAYKDASLQVHNWHWDFTQYGYEERRADRLRARQLRKKADELCSKAYTIQRGE